MSNFEKKKIKIGSDCSSEPINGSCLVFFEHDYSKIYNVFKDTNLLVYPIFTSKKQLAGKAYILDKDGYLIAKYTSNGTFTISDYDVFFKSVKFKTLNTKNFISSFTYMMDFFKRINVITSYEKSFLSVLEEKVSDLSSLNLTFRASRKDRFFMDDMFGNKSNEKIINYSKLFVLGEDCVFEQVSFNMFSSFKIFMQPVNDDIRLDFHLKVFKAYCVIQNNNYDRLDLLMKKCVKSFLSNKKDIDFDLDYIFTESFFIEYDTIKQMMEI